MPAFLGMSQVFTLWIRLRGVANHGEVASVITSLVVAAMRTGKVIGRLSAVFSAARPTALAKANVLPQVCTSQDWPLARIPRVACPVSASSLANDVRERTVAEPQWNSAVKAVAVPVWR